MFHRLSHKGHTVTTISAHQGIYLLYNAIRIFTALLRHSDQCVYLFQQNVIYFTNLCHLVHEIYTIFEKQGKNLNAHSEKFSELGQLGFNLAFKRLIYSQQNWHYKNK